MNNESCPSVAFFKIFENEHRLRMKLWSIFRVEPGPFLFPGQFQPGNVLTNVCKFNNVACASDTFLMIMIRVFT